MKQHICPNCYTEMQATYEPYQVRCPKCGFWFDTYTGKPISFAGEKPNITTFKGDDYEMTGHRLCMTVEMCHQPLMTVVIIGLNRDKRRWLGRYIDPKGLDSLVILTEDFLEYVSSQP